jgi:serine/threonine-protein kinase RsbW/sigma-B regulation protein RsbU (phosphoserine phosphatase)
MKMTVLHRDDGITHVVLAGRLDTTGAEAIMETFSAATAARPRPAIVELSDVDFMASRGIGLLVTSGQRLIRAGHKMVLLNPRGLVESVLRTSKVDRALPLVFGLEEAVRMLGGAAAPPAGSSSAPAAAPEVAATGPAPPVVEGQLKLSIRNAIAELNAVTAAVDPFFASHHVPYRAAYAISLAIDELVSNVIRYAYVDDETHLIDLEIAIEGGQVILRIVDDGRPFDPRTGPALDLHAEDREAGGLGLLLVLDMVDTLKYRRTEEKNHVEVRVHLVATGASSDVLQAS